MISFEYYNPAKIIFGEESEKNLKGLLKSYNVKSLLLVYSGDFIKTLGIYSVIEDAVNELGIKFSENGNVVPNPSVELVRELVKQGKKDNVVLFVCLFLAILLVYAFLPRIFAFLSGLSRVPSSVVRFLEPLCAHTGVDLAKVLFVSSCRYVVFSLQYYFMLRFFMIDLPLAYGAIFIATNYLIITFVPSMSFSELAVRAGVASVVFAPLTDNMIGVMATGASTWLVNYLLPMLLGSVVWLKYNPEKKKNLESYG